MRRLLAIGAVAITLAYFLDPRYGRRRREAALAWLNELAQRLSERAATLEEAPIGTTGNGRPAVGEERPAVAEPPVEERPAAAEPPAEEWPAAAAEPPVEDRPAAAQEPLAEERPAAAVVAAEEPPIVGPLAAPAPEEVPSAVAVEERPVAEAPLPPPLPADVIETPMRDEVVDERRPRAEAPRKRRGWLIGGVLIVVAALAAAAGLAAWSFDVFDSENGGPNAEASALNALAQRQARAISIMAQPGARRIPVVGAEEKLLLVVGVEGDAVLIVSRLEQAPPGKAYEIWVISGKTPKPAGLFRGGTDAVIPLTRSVPKGATVALTLERFKGSPRPTSKPLFAVTRS